MDLRVILKENQLHTDLYVKPTDKFQYLNFKSSHPYHQKANLPYGLALRIKRICSNEEDFKKHCDQLIILLRKRGYKLGLIKDAIRKVSALKRDEVLSNASEQSTKNKMIFATTYNPMLPDFKQKLIALQPILHSSEKCKKLFPEPPIVAYRRNRNLNDLLVSRRLPRDIVINSNTMVPTVDKDSNVCEECGMTFVNGKGKMIHYTKMHTNIQNPPSPPVGFSPCGDKRCNTCRLGTFGSTVYVSAMHKTFIIKHRITCKTSNVIYCVTCKKCQDQYIGETNNEIHNRQAGHLSDIRLNKPGLPYVSHFQRCGIENYTITGVEKVRQNNTAIRKERENFYKQLFDVQIH